MSAKDTVARLLRKADIEVNGTRPWDPQIHNDEFYTRILADGSLAAGESYMDGWWDVEALDEFVHRVLGARLEKEVGKSPEAIFHILRSKLFNQQSRSRAFQVGEQHYDVGNDLYERMLDKRMAYTCGYWSGTPKAQTLDEAQEAKLDLICRKIGLKKGDRVLDLGGGWAPFAKYAAEKYGAEVVVYTVSKEQAELGRKLTKGLPVDIRLEDYRDAAGGPYDHVVAIGLMEHIGYKNYKTFIQVAHSQLKDDGLFLLHTIGGTKTETATDPWIDKYIFPNGMLPSIRQIAAAIEGVFVMEDWHNFGSDYDRTLMEWYKNFDTSWPEIKDKYSERFYRMWKYYLLICAGSFRARKNQLWQIVLSKNGVPGGYTSVR